MTDGKICILIASHSESPFKSLKRPFKEICNIPDGLIPEGFEYYLKNIAGLESQNQVWSELTTLVEGYKFFGDATYVGIGHYRRFLALGKEESNVHEIRKSILERQIIAEEQSRILPKYLNKVVIANPLELPTNLLENFENCHAPLLSGLEEACHIFDDVVKKRFGTVSSIQVLQQTNLIHPYNMFLGPIGFYNEWIEILWPILRKLDSMRDQFPTIGYQSRWGGFIIERVFSVYMDLLIEENRWRVVQTPVYFFENQGEYDKLKEGLFLKTQEAMDKEIAIDQLKESLVLKTQEAMDKEIAIDQLRESLFLKTQEAMDKEIAIDQLRVTLEMLFFSKSWKITAPLRYIKKKIKGERGG